MEWEVKQTRGCEDVQPTSGGGRTDTNHSGKNHSGKNQNGENQNGENQNGENRSGKNQSGKEARYWGILCKRCRELVAFDASPYESFGPGAASMKPGAICCRRGHNHIYFPRDFGFHSSAAPIAEAEMKENRDTYRAINSQGKGSSHDFVPKAVSPADPAADDAVPAPESGKARPARPGRDPRREAVGKDAKERWGNWADSNKSCAG
jgi:hypothetical protein